MGIQQKISSTYFCIQLSICILIFFVTAVFRNKDFDLNTSMVHLFNETEFKKIKILHDKLVIDFCIISF